jgi:hypothetical protein
MAAFDRAETFERSLGIDKPWQLDVSRTTPPPE